MELRKARVLGAAAQRAGRQRAPTLCREVYDAVHGMKVGEGASSIFGAYTAGWDEEQRKADARSIPAMIHAASK